MKNLRISRPHRLAILGATFAGLLIVFQDAHAATWKGLEPFVSKRADVERVLGRPTLDRFRDGTLGFNSPDGEVTVFFVTPKFTASKKLPAHLEGTVLQIIVQHKSSTDTPESMNLVNNSTYERRRGKVVDVFSDPKAGIYYTFVANHLKTTRYSYSAEQLTALQNKN